MPALQIKNEREFAFSDAEFAFIADIAHNITGIVINASKRDMVYSRLVRRLRALSLRSFADYCKLLQSAAGEQEIGNLVNAITTNLTGFFRESHHFEHLHEHVLTPLLQNPPPDKKIRLWSSACSSGMEPYSMAMTLHNCLGDKLNRFDAKILATDIDTAMLKVASQGHYDASELKNIAGNNRKYIEKLAGNQFAVNDALKQSIIFKQLNLLESWQMKGLFDAIFCRNVVIYFDKPTQAKLFDRIADKLKPGGILYIGHSENLFKVCNRFELIGRTTYRRII